MKRHLLTFTVIAFITLALVNISYAQSMGEKMPMQGKMEGKILLTGPAVDLRMDMRKLWEDHIN